MSTDKFVHTYFLAMFFVLARDLLSAVFSTHCLAPYICFSFAFTDP